MPGHTEYRVSAGGPFFVTSCLPLVGLRRGLHKRKTATGHSVAETSEDNVSWVVVVKAMCTVLGGVHYLVRALSDCPGCA